MRGQAVLRAPAGACEIGAGPVSIDRWDDGGWRSTRVPGLLAVTGIELDADGRGLVVGAGADCGPVGFRSRDGGVTWRESEGEPPIWSVLPGDTSQLTSPDGRVGVPCRPRAVSGIDASVARVWCSDGRIHGTASSGAEWVVLGQLDDAEAPVFLTPADGFALATAPDCTGTVVTTTHDGGTTWQPGQCVTVAGPWGLAGDGTGVVVVGSDGFEVSRDSGDTWSAG